MVNPVEVGPVEFCKHYVLASGLRVVPLSLCPSSETVEKKQGENGRTKSFFPAAFFRVIVLSDKGTTRGPASS